MMKQLRHWAWLSAAAILISLSGCSGEEEQAPKEISITAVSSGPYSWHKGDALTWFEGSIPTKTSAASDISADGKTAVFKMTLKDGGTHEGFFGFGFKMGESVYFAEKYNQNELDVQDAAQAFLHSGKGFMSMSGTEVKVSMETAGSLIAVYPFMEADAAETLESVTVSTDKAICGNVSFNHAASECNGIMAGAGNSITVSPRRIAVPSTASKAVFIPVPPAEGLGGITITVCTDKSDYIFTHPEIGGFEQGKTLKLECRLDEGSILGSGSVFGKVLDTEGVPFAGAVISDGYSSVAAGKDGAFSLKVNDACKFIQCSIPADAAVVKEGPYNIPCSYYKVYDPKIREYNFSYKRQTEEKDIRIICLGDPQTKTSSRSSILTDEVVPDVNSFCASGLTASTYGITAGDNVENTWDQLPEIASIYGKISIPVFPTIGNHDHDYHLVANGDESPAREEYGAVFGPSNYSFNRGDLHIVVMDDIYFSDGTSKGYKTAFEPWQAGWLKSDLSFVPKDKFILVSWHGPISNSTSNAAGILEALSAYPNHQIIVGHTHRVCNTDDISYGGKTIRQCDVGAVGAPWKGNCLADGCPKGYRVMTFSGAKMTDDIYKPIGKAASYQMRMYHTNDYPGFDGGDGMQSFSYYGDDWVAVNCFNYSSGWTVDAYENGVKTSSKVEQKTSWDMWVRKFMFDNYGVDSDGGKNNHMLYYRMVDKSCKNLKFVAKDLWGHTYEQNQFTTDFNEAKRK